MITIRNLEKRYDERAVVDDVSVTLPAGKVISMIGPTRCTGGARCGRGPWERS